MSLAVHAYVQYLSIDHFRWADPCQDRNTFYVQALKLAREVRSGHLFGFLREFERARAWPPLHNILAAGVLTVGGFDHRLAVLPSLVCWVGTVWLAFRIARRAAPGSQIVAGLLAAFMVVWSPAHRVFATDVMLESLGAFLTLLALDRYLAVLATLTPRHWRGLALTLTLLFLTKYNYWLLSLLNLVAAYVLPLAWQQRHTWLTTIKSLDLKGQLTRLIRSPVLYALLISLAFPVYAVITGGGTYRFLGTTIEAPIGPFLLYPPYLVCFIAALVWWLSKRSAAIRMRNPGLLEFVVWHLWPVAIWLAIPHRLGYFLYYIGPWNGDAPPSTLWEGVRFYLRHIADDYHDRVWMAGIAAGFILIALAAWRRNSPAARACIVFFAVSAFFTLRHPYHQSRFAHSWVALGWVCAAVGAAITLRALPVRVRLGAGLLSLAVLVVLQRDALLMPGRSPEMGHNDLRLSSLDLTNAYLPALASAHHPAFFSTMPMKQMAEWTWLERYPDRAPLEVFLRRFGEDPAENRARFQDWLNSSPTDIFAFVDVSRDSPFYLSRYDSYQQYKELIESQSIFVRDREVIFPEHGCKVSVWHRAH